MRSYLAACALLMVIVLQCQVHIDASPSGMSSDSSDDTSSIPILASGKRQHNIMRFGKRPSSGHSLIHFGKRDSPTKGHSFMYFGKRSPDQQDLQQSPFWDYFQKSRDGSFKRGHSIMRFGKRGAPTNTHSFIRFGRGAEDDEDLEKRTTGHSMMYFGKRDGNPGHSMMYFGKRGTGHSMMYFGKRDGEEDFDKRANNGHSMMYFGKRDGEDDFDKRASGHSMLYFGKRDAEEDFDKRANNGHSMMYFGKRDGEDDFDKRTSGHSMMYFGKRDADEEKRAHSMIHFGKREGPGKGTHAMIHFGKRDSDDVEGMDDEIAIDDASPDIYLDPEMKRQHNLLRFGKKMDGKGSHAMIHFGKRDDVIDEDKRAHAMIHFGKRSADDDAVAGNRSDEEKNLNRVKREVSPVTLVRYDEGGDEVPSDSDDDGSLMNPKMSGIFGYPLEHPDEDWEPNYVEFPGKKDGGKNVFLRFG